MFPKNENMKNDIKSISDALCFLDEQINEFMEKYDLAFYYFNTTLYALYIHSVEDKFIKQSSLDKSQINQVFNFNYTKFMNSMTKTCTKFIENIKKNVTIFSTETIVKELNSMNDLCFNLMNK